MHNELQQENLKDLLLIKLSRSMDMRYENKDVIEKKLNTRQKNLFNLKENVILYDLTSNCFEGNNHDGMYDGSSKLGLKFVAVRIVFRENSLAADLPVRSLPRPLEAGDTLGVEEEASSADADFHSGEAFQRETGVHRDVFR